MCTALHNDGWARATKLTCSAGFTSFAACPHSETGASIDYSSIGIWACMNARAWGGVPCDTHGAMYNVPSG
jgi:hypothetical protein